LNEKSEPESEGGFSVAKMPNVLRKKKSVCGGRLVVCGYRNNLENLSFFRMPAKGKASATSQ